MRASSEPGQRKADWIAGHSKTRKAWKERISRGDLMRGAALSLVVRGGGCGAVSARWEWKHSRCHPEVARCVNVQGFQHAWRREVQEDTLCKNIQYTVHAAGRRVEWARHRRTEWKKKLRCGECRHKTSLTLYKHGCITSWLCESMPGKYLYLYSVRYVVKIVCMSYLILQSDFVPKKTAEDGLTDASNSNFALPDSVLSFLLASSYLNAASYLYVVRYDVQQQHCARTTIPLCFAAARCVFRRLPVTARERLQLLPCKLIRRT